MSMHKIDLSGIEHEGLKSHGLPIGKPSQLSDAFRQGMAWALSAAPQPPALGGEPEVTAWIISDEDGTIDATVRWDVAKNSFGDVTLLPLG